MSDSTKIIQTDVLICGSGSAGLTAALWLAKYDIAFRVLERRDGPLVKGQADGVQCRTVEIFESFGLSDQLLRESYHVLELAFWSPGQHTELSNGEKGGIKWSHYAPDTEPGLSHQPHVILNQARINEMITKEMLKCGGAEIDYGYNVKSVHVDSNTARDPDSYPVTVTAVKNGVEQVFRAKYALGCDGAHSAVRKALGFKMLGDSTDAIWGVMDLYPRTTFPDIRKKAVIQSVSGNLIIIPREGDSLVRFYIELPPDTVASKVTLEDLQQRAKLIFRPYEMDIAETTWWSAYQIGQRLADNFHEQYRVFLTGDACHTHSPKAGQGMNVSLQDGYNIGWKLGSYLSGQATEELVKTYVSERQQTAAELIEFDRMWSKIFKSGAANGAGPDYVRDQFVKAGRYTAGQAYKYGKSIITRPLEEPQKTNGTVTDQSKSQLVVGMRLPSAQVVRYSDGKVHQLLSVIRADRRWRVVVFAGDIQQEGIRGRLERVASSIESTVRTFATEGQDEDSVIESLLVLKTKRTGVYLEQIPTAFRPTTGKHRIQSEFGPGIETWQSLTSIGLHKLFVDDESYNSGHGHAFDTIAVDHEAITIVVVRPDQCAYTLKNSFLV